MTTYPKRLIEVDLPIRRISAHARREKSIRHGHISTLHIWWARRPLAACRAVICASLWPDPADPLCPAAFIDAAKKEMRAWTTHERQSLLSEESRKRFAPARTNQTAFDDLVELRQALLDFIADFADWDNSTVAEYLASSRALTAAAHNALASAATCNPMIVEPFAGGGSIPLEGLRVGADVFASDLNPIAVLLNVLIGGCQLSKPLLDQYNAASARVSSQFSQMWNPGIFARFWARTILCEGPACGVEIPLIRDGRLSNRSRHGMFFVVEGGKHTLETSPLDSKVLRPMLQVQPDARTSISTCSNGSVTCPVCNFTHKQSQVARQAMRRGFGQRLLAIGHVNDSGKCYRQPSALEEAALVTAVTPSSNKIATCLSVPINPLRPSSAARGMSAVTRYGYAQYKDLFASWQLNQLEDVRIGIENAVAEVDAEHRSTVHILLSVTLDRIAAFQNMFCRWAPKGEHPVPPFGKNGFPMIWDYAEAAPFGGSSGSWEGATDWVRRVLEHLLLSRNHQGTVQQADSRDQLLPDKSADAWITDPPYYDSYPYADLSDFFYPLFRASLADGKTVVSELFASALTPKDGELVLQPTRLTPTGPKDHNAYQNGMTDAFKVGRLVTKDDGIGIVVFANKTTSGWEALLSSVCDAGWKVTASWPIDTERESRSAGQARLQSSVHLVCRPREGSMHMDEIGDWRDVLKELPRQIHEWMPRLAEEGVVGADAIFACLGPALEVFSRYSRVETAGGEPVSLKTYLEHVWAAVSKEALSVIFAGADTEGFEPDARLTAMWLWTLAGPAKDPKADDGDAEDNADDEDDESGKKGKKKGGFTLEYDAARKIAQGLGANLEDLRYMVEVSGETARLLPVAERTAYLFGKEQAEEPLATKRKKKQDTQPDLFAELAQEGVSEKVWMEK